MPDIGARLDLRLKERYHPSGTASLPGISFAEDTNLGWFRQAADVLSLTTSGVERIRLSSATVAFQQAETITVPATTSLILNALTTGAVIIQGGGIEIVRANSTGAGFYGSAPVVKQASGANLTNNVTSGGVDDTIANYTDLVTYGNDAAAIRNDIYQLSRKVKQINDGLRLYGLLT